MKYFNIRQRAWQPIPGRIYIVALPIHMTFPKLRGHPLIAHKCPAGNGWVVAHQATGFAVSRGKTRAAAVDAAHHTLMTVGEEKFLAAVASAEARIAALIDGAGAHAYDVHSA